LYDLLKSNIRTMGIPGVSGLGWISPSMQVGSYVGSDMPPLGIGAYSGGYEGSLSGLGTTQFPGENETDYYGQGF
jgi:hypothetical protein